MRVFITQIHSTKVAGLSSRGPPPVHRDLNQREIAVMDGTMVGGRSAARHDFDSIDAWNI